MTFREWWIKFGGNQTGQGYTNVGRAAWNAALEEAASLVRDHADGCRARSETFRKEEFADEANRAAMDALLLDDCVESIRASKESS